MNVVLSDYAKTELEPQNAIPVGMTDTSIPAAVNISLLKVLRYANPALRKIVGQSLRQLGCSRRTRLHPKDNGAAGIIARWPSLYSLDVEVHALSQHIGPPICHLTDKGPVLLIDRDLLDNGSGTDPATLFEVGMALAPLSMGIVCWANAEDLQIPLAACVIRQFAPDFLCDDSRTTHFDLDESKLQKYLERQEYTSVMGLMLELSGSINADGIMEQAKVLDRAFRRLALIPIRFPGEIIANLKKENEHDFKDALSYLLSERVTAMRKAIFEVPSET